MTAAIAVLLVTFSVTSFVVAGNFKRVADDEKDARERETAARIRESDAREVALAAAASEKPAKEKAVEQRDLAEELEKKAVAAKEELAYREYVAGMHFARSLWEEGKLSQLKRLLADYIPSPGSNETDLRRFEWYHWWRAVHLEKESVFFSGPASRVAVIPDRNLLIIPRYPNKISVVDMKDPQAQQTTIDALMLWENAPRISQDGRVMFHFGTKHGKRVIVRHDTNTWDVIPDGTIELENDISAFSVSPTGRHIAVAEQHKAEPNSLWYTIHILTMDGKPLTKLPQLKLPESPYHEDFPPDFHPSLGNSIKDMAFSPDGNTLLVGYDRGMARAQGFLKDPSKLDWQLIKGPEVWKVLWQRVAVAAIAYSSDGKQLATCGFDGVRLWDPETLKPVEPVPLLRTTLPVTSVRFSPSGNLLAACGSRDQAAYVWNIDRKLNTLMYQQHGPAVIRGHARRVVDVAFASEDEFWTIGNDGIAKVWNLKQCQRVEGRRLSLNTDQTDLYFHPDGHGLIYTNGSAKKVKGEWHAGRAKLIPLNNIHSSSPVTKPAIPGTRQPPGTRVVNGNWLVEWTPQDRKLRVRNLNTEEIVGIWDVEDIEKKKLAISRDGKTVAWGHSAIRLEPGRFTPPKVTLLKVAAGNKPETYNCPTERGFLGWMRLSPDGKRLAVRGFSATDFLDISEGFPRRIRRLRDQGTDTCGAFSPDGKLLAIGSWISDIRIHDGRTGEPLRCLRGHSGLVKCLAFSTDGKTLVSGGTDGTVRIWDPQRGELRTTLSQDADSVESVAISPGGRVVASHGTDHALRLWRGAADTDEELSPESIGKYYQKKGHREFAALLYDKALKDRRRSQEFLPRKSDERHTSLFQRALMEYHFGKTDEYQRICDEIAREFGDTESLSVQERTLNLFTFANVEQSNTVREVVRRFSQTIGKRIDRQGDRSGEPGLAARYLYLAQGIAHYRN
ncbi:MAG: hypothetical protein KDA84_25780, partial [Planctomycetaceae bacterium]|nr:hypothetical protein [Planctomycetaceae bacterium]